MRKNVVVEDYVLIESFIKISYAIEGLYHKLYMLEIKNLKESNEYKRYLGYLEMSLEYEDELYKETKLNVFKCRDLINLIINRYINKKMVNDLESVLSRKYENAYLRRVINKLNTIMKNDYSGMQELLINDEFIISDSVDFDYIFLENMINDNLMNCYVERIILLLQEKIDETSDIKVINKLIRDKYYTSFIFPNCEKKLVKDSFNIEDKIYDNTEFIIFLSGIEKKIYQEIQKEFLEKETRKIFYKTLFKESSENKSKEKMILRECLIRALFMMMDNELIIKLNEEINNISNFNSDSIKALFNNCVSLNKKDQQKQFILKF